MITRDADPTELLRNGSPRRTPRLPPGGGSCPGPIGGGSTARPSFQRTRLAQERPPRQGCAGPLPGWIGLATNGIVFDGTVPGVGKLDGVRAQILSGLDSTMAPLLISNNARPDIGDFPGVVIRD